MPKQNHKLHALILGFVLLMLLIVTPYLLYRIINVQPASKITYGVTFSKPYATSLGLNWRESYLAILDDLKVNNLRLSAYWNESEIYPGSYDFSSVLWQLDEAKKRNVNVVMTIGRKVPRWPECHEPYWIKGKSDAELQSALLKLLKAEVEAFKGYDNIIYWQVENEPFFPYGDCAPFTFESLKEELTLVRSLDSRPIIIQDSGEGGFWVTTHELTDHVGISMYRRVGGNLDLILLNHKFSLTYPFSYWYYALKARFIGISLDHIQVLELQAEPWGEVPIPKLSKQAKDNTMSHEKFLETINFAHKSGFDVFYLWGAEWWYYEKQVNNDSFFWNEAKKFWSQ